ncbi:MAG: XdhC family protein [Oscillospiraceae bacterium]|nr:XdhC family protein [Oscillospiraceae bacterium]
MKQLCESAIKLLEAGECFVQATILESSGSVPRGKGACMLCLKDGRILGTIGGGAIEAGIIKIARSVFNNRTATVVDMKLDGKDAVATGMICGGSATVFVDFIDAKNPANLEFFATMLTALKKGIRTSMIIAPPTKDAYAERFQCLLPHNGTPQVTQGMAQDVLIYLSGETERVPQMDRPKIYMHRLGADGTAYVFGAGHCGVQLVQVLNTIGFRTVVIDDRAEFANAVRFPDADEILVPKTMDLSFGQIEWSEDSYIIIVTRGHAQDELVLRGALKTPACYVGMIGSKTKRNNIYRRLLADGYTQADIDSVNSPIGIPIEADTPEEIAISIAAELIRVRAGRKGGES